LKYGWLLRDEYPLYKKDKTSFKGQFSKYHSQLAGRFYFQEDIALFIAAGMLARNQDLFLTIVTRDINNVISPAKPFKFELSG
jgi:hypothetical protein